MENKNNFVISKYARLLEKSEFEKSSNSFLKNYRPIWKPPSKLELEKEKEKQYRDANGNLFDESELILYKKKVAENMLKKLSESDEEIDERRRQIQISLKKPSVKRSMILEEYRKCQLKYLARLKNKDATQFPLSPNYEYKYKKIPNLEFSKIERFGRAPDKHLIKPIGELPEKCKKDKEKSKLCYKLNRQYINKLNELCKINKGSSYYLAKKSHSCFFSPNKSALTTNIITQNSQIYEIKKRLSYSGISRESENENNCRYTNNKLSNTNLINQNSILNYNKEIKAKNISDVKYIKEIEKLKRSNLSTQITNLKKSNKKLGKFNIRRQFLNKEEMNHNKSLNKNLSIFELLTNKKKINPLSFSHDAKIKIKKRLYEGEKVKEEIKNLYKKYDDLHITQIKETK